EKTTTKVYYSEDGISYSPTTLAGILQKGGTQTVFVKVASENGTEEIYTVVVSREKSTNTDIDGIQIQELPTFQPISSIPNAGKTIYTYTLRDLSSTELIVTVQEKLGENQTVQFLNSERQPISTIIQVDSLEYGNNTFYVVVTAQNGSTQKEYQLVIVKQSDAREIVSIEIQDREKGLITIDPSKYVVTQSGNSYSIKFNFELTNKVKVIVTTSDYSTIVASGATNIIGNKAYFDKDFTSTAMQTITLGTITVKAQNNVATEYSVELIREAADSDNKLANININNIDLPGFLATKYAGYDLFVIDRNSNS